MNLDNLVKEMQKSFGFSELKPDKNQSITLNIDDIFITICQQEDYFLLVTRLCDLPENKLELYKLALQENNFGKLLGYYGVLTEDNSLIYTSKINIFGLDIKYFFHRLEKHVDYANDFINKLFKLNTELVKSKYNNELLEVGANYIRV